MALHGDNDIDDLLASWGGEEATTSSKSVTNQSLSSTSKEKKKLKKKNRKRSKNNIISFVETRLSQNCFQWPSSSVDSKRFLYLGSGLVHGCKGYTYNDQSSYGSSICQYCGKSAATHELCISSSSILGDNNDDIMMKCHPLSILSVANIIVSSRNIRCLISEHYPEGNQKNELVPPLNSIAVSPQEISNKLDVHTGRILITLKRMQNEILKPSNKHQYRDIQKEFKTLCFVASISRSDIEILQERTKILISCMQEYKKAIASTTNVNTTSSINILEKRLSAIIACDAIYYRCYYSAIISPCSNDRNVNGNIMASIIPHPPTYFSCPGLSWDVNSGLESLRIFLGESSNYEDLAAPLDESTKQMILKSWGLEDRLLLNATTTSRQDEATNPLLTLWQSRFIETIRHVWCTRYSKIQSRALQTTSTTKLNAADDVLKLHDTTAISPEVSLWRDSVREYPANFYAYASPTDEALQFIFKLMESLEVEQIVEQGAGTGYWSSLLNTRLTQKRLETNDQAKMPLVEAYDISPPSSEGNETAIASSNEYHGNVPTFMHVQKADAHDSTRTSSKNTALLLCYPPPDSDMAYDALTAHINKGGQVVIHIGEFQGLTGNAMFEELLKQQFYCDEKDILPLPVWGTDATYLTIWRKVDGDNTAASSCSTSAIGYCSSENCLNEARRRCRYARCLQYCSLECYQSHSSRRRALLALHMICVEQEELLNYEDDNHFLDLREIVSMKRDTTAHDDSYRPRKKRKKKKRR